jgi:signal transduction histidine kinase
VARSDTHIEVPSAVPAPTVPVGADVGGRGGDVRFVVRVYEATVVGAVLAVLGVSIAVNPGQFAYPELIGWALAVAAMDLMPVQGPASAQLSLSFPILLAAAMFFMPPVAAAVALAGSIDHRELKRTIRPLKALFVRSEVALSVLMAGVVFHLIANLGSPVRLLIPAVVAAVATDYLVNTAVVGAYLTLSVRLPSRRVLSGLMVGKPYEFVLSYLGLGLLASVMALLYKNEKTWVVLLFFGPLLLARQMFFRTRELQRTTEELRTRHVELERALHELATLEAERRLLLERTVEATEEERRRIAAELHDGPIQHLAAIVFRLESLRAPLERGDIPAQAVPTIEATQDELRDEVVELRRMITQLRPPVLDQLGLEDALHDHLDSVRQDSGLDVSIRIDLAERLEPDLETVLYRVSQEALTNIVKHAGADHVWVALGEADHAVTLEIRDDGVGFSPEETPTLVQDGHLGLIAMRERVETVGGSWELRSSPGEGTVVRAVFAGRASGSAEGDGPAASVR